MENDINIEPVITVKSLLVDSINKKHFDYIKKTIDNNVSVSNLLYTQVCFFIKLFLLNDFENYKIHNDYQFDKLFIEYCFNLIKYGEKKINQKFDNPLFKRAYDFIILHLFEVSLCIHIMKQNKFCL